MRVPRAFYTLVLTSFNRKESEKGTVCVRGGGGGGEGGASRITLARPLPHSLGWGGKGVLTDFVKKEKMIK